VYNRNHPHPYVLALFIVLSLPRCGTEEGAFDTNPLWSPEKTPACETLVSQVLQDPLRGGEFHCLWCRRQWEWEITSSSPSLFILVAITCEALGSDAYLEIRDAKGTVVWHQQIEQGPRETYCIRHDSPATGTYSVGLYGHRNLLLKGNLIEEFRGSVYLKIFDEQGEYVRPSND
jgi:hypothetical protein